jgi:flagellar capping protein FliD
MMCLSHCPDKAGSIFVKTAVATQQELVKEVRENSRVLRVHGSAIGELKQEVRDVNVRLAIMDKHTSGIDERIDILKEDVGTLKGEMNQRFEQVDRRFDQMDQRFNQVIALLAQRNEGNAR